MAIAHEDLAITAGGVVLYGDLRVPDHATGIVVFAHGSGSSRRSTRNAHVAAHLRRQHLGTLLFDLLTAPEEADDARFRAYRFDIVLLARRLIETTDWLLQQPGIPPLLGLFGASTGAAAALVAAAERPDAVAAVVSRGGRPDLAGDAVLERVRAPTLLIVGGADNVVLDLNERAAQRLQCEKEVIVIPGATHLFEETGALDTVTRCAAQWFVQYLAPLDPNR